MKKTTHIIENLISGRLVKYIVIGFLIFAITDYVANSVFCHRNADYCVSGDFNN